MSFSKANKISTVQPDKQMPNINSTQNQQGRQQQTITIPLHEYTQLQSELEKYKLQNYTLKIENQKIIKGDTNSKDINEKMNYYIGKGSSKTNAKKKLISGEEHHESKSRQKIHEEQQEDDTEQNLMVSWHPSVKKVHGPNKKSQQQKTKFIKDMKSWSSSLGTQFQTKKMPALNHDREQHSNQQLYHSSKANQAVVMNTQIKHLGHRTSEQPRQIIKRQIIPQGRKSEEASPTLPMLERLKKQKVSFEEEIEEMQKQNVSNPISNENNENKQQKKLKRTDSGQIEYVIQLKKKGSLENTGNNFDKMTININDEFASSPLGQRNDEDGYNFISMCQIPNYPQELQSSLTVQNKKQTSSKVSQSSFSKHHPKQKSDQQIRHETQAHHLAHYVQTKLHKVMQMDDQQPLIEAICLFGPSKKTLQKCLSANVMNGNPRKFMAPQSMLLFSSNNLVSPDTTPKQYQVYGQYFYPEEGQSVCRKIKQQDKNTQANQIIFRKNAKREDCGLFLFRGDELWQNMYGRYEGKKNKQEQKRAQFQGIQWKLLSRVNAGKMLCAFVLQFSDYQMVEEKDKDLLMREQACKNKSFQIRNSQNNRSATVEEEETIDDNYQRKNSDRGRLQNNTDHHISSQVLIKSKYNLCIFTYFPLVNPMENILTAIIDEIKIRRVEEYAKSQSEISKVTIQFVTQQLLNICEQINMCVTKIPTKIIVRPNLKDIIEHKYYITFHSNKKVEFNLSKDMIYQTMFAGWVFDILKLFEKDQLYEIFNYILFEQSVCFVSENLSLLTHTIFLFISVFLHPFSYPYPCISQVSDLQFLDSPFIVTTGICKSSKWLEQNYLYLSEKKIYIDLNHPEELKIKMRTKPKLPKSEKLKKIFNNFYKKLPEQLPQIFKKKQTVIRPVTRDQNYNVYNFIFSLRTYYQQQLIRYLPNVQIITFIKNTVKQQNQTSKMFNLLKQIEKYVRESRKQLSKDPFVDNIVQQQVFYMYVSLRYGLN